MRQCKGAGAGDKAKHAMIHPPIPLSRWWLMADEGRTSACTALSVHKCTAQPSLVGSAGRLGAKPRAAAEAPRPTARANMSPTVDDRPPLRSLLGRAGADGIAPMTPDYASLVPPLIAEVQSFVTQAASTGDAILRANLSTSLHRTPLQATSIAAVHAVEAVH